MNSDPPLAPRAPSNLARRYQQAQGSRISMYVCTLDREALPLASCELPFIVSKMRGRTCRLKNFSRAGRDGEGPVFSRPLSSSRSVCTSPVFYAKGLQSLRCPSSSLFFPERSSLTSFCVRMFTSTPGPLATHPSNSSSSSSPSSVHPPPLPPPSWSPSTPSASSSSSSPPPSASSSSSSSPFPLPSSDSSASEESVLPSLSPSRSFPLGVKHSKTSLDVKHRSPSVSASLSQSASASSSSLKIFETPEGTRWVPSVSLSRYLSRCVGLGYLQALLEDSTVEEHEVFDLLWTRILKLPPSASAACSQEGKEKSQELEADSPSEGDADKAWKVSVEDLTRLLQGCVAVGLRDFSLLDVLSDVLGPLLTSAKISQLTDISQSCRALGVLRPVLFTFLASRLITLSQSSSSSSSLPPCRLLPRQAVLLLEGLASQRYPHPQLLSLLEDAWTSSLPSLPPRLACRVVHGLANLGRFPGKPETLQLLFARISVGLSSSERNGSGEQAGRREEDEEEEEAQQQESSSAHLRLTDLARVAHALFLWEIEVDQKDLLFRLLNLISTEIAQRPDSFWSKSRSEVSLHKRLLLVRSGLRHLRREEIYDELPVSVKTSLRRLHRIEISRDPRPPTNFVTKMSSLLTRLRIAHFCYATRGPLVFDILERDRRLVWFCNSVDRFYVNSAEKTTSTRLKERLTRSLGLRVVNCEYWQWTKMKRKRTRIEYLRMRRYYALKDRREHDEDFEGWTLPLVHHTHRKNKLHYEYYFPNYAPLSRIEY